VLEYAKKRNSAGDDRHGDIARHSRRSSVLSRIGAYACPHPLLAGATRSESTVKTHVGKVYEKLGAHNRASAIMAAVRLGFVKSNVDGSQSRP